MIDKSINDINCVDVREKLKQPIYDAIHLYKDRSQVLDDFTWKNGTPILPPNSNATIHFDITVLEELVIFGKFNLKKNNWNHRLRHWIGIDAKWDMMNTKYTAFSALSDTITNVILRSYSSL